jgi:carboxyl-terminal processing protease
LKVTISRYYTPSGRCIQALDYWHRDENGDPVRKDAKEYNAFKTKHGRTVYDGGGILPDIELKSAVFSPITTALLRDNAIFDYATKYYYSHKITDLQSFRFTENDFNDFLTYLKKNDFNYETETEKKFAEGFKTAEDDDLSKDISASYNQLMATIDDAKDKAIVDKKAEIETLLTDEILKRYFYRDGLYNYQVVHNPVILEAVSVLDDDARYNKILE